MSESLSFLELAKFVLRETQKPLTVGQIWKIARERGYDQRLNQYNPEDPPKTPRNTLSSALGNDVKRRREDSDFVRFEETQPITYFLRELLSDKKAVTEVVNEVIEEQEEIEKEEEKNTSYLESFLHPFLCYFLRNRLYLASKTIRHQTSRKYGSKVLEWTHPDMIACSIPYYTFDSSALINFASKAGATVVNLFSFELKRRLAFSNLRESFFQCVSNSS